jgi:hypothetical protein
MKSFTITKKVAKHGSQAIVVIPRLLETELKPGTIVKMTIDVIKKPDVFLGHRKSEGFSSVLKEAEHDI